MVGWELEVVPLAMWLRKNVAPNCSLPPDPIRTYLPSTRSDQSPYLRRRGTPGNRSDLGLQLETQNSPYTSLQVNRH